MGDCNKEVSTWRPRSACDNLMDGPEPTLTDELAALIIGTEDPVNNPHTAEGPSISQAKANATTAAKKFINSLGGDLQLGGVGSVITAQNPITAVQERVLTLTDQFLPLDPTEITAAVYVAQVSDFGKTRKHVVPAGGTIELGNGLANVPIGKTVQYLVQGAAGITDIFHTGAQFLIEPASGTVVPFGRTVTIMKTGSTQFQYIGP